MGKSIYKTGERVIPVDFSDEEEYLMYLRHLFVYEFAKNNISKDSIVLELGCGEGYGTKRLSHNVQNIIGIDVDEKTIEHASGKYTSSNCNFQLYNGEAVPFKDDAFDAIVSFQVIEHVQNDVNYVSEIFRVLKPGGIFLLTTPNATYRLVRGQKPWNKYHIREYYPDELEAVLKSKFPDTVVWGICSTEYLHKIEIEKAKRALSMKAHIIAIVGTIIPENIKPLIWKAIRRFKRRKDAGGKSTDFLNKYDIDYFHITKDHPGESLDLLAICKK